MTDTLPPDQIPLLLERVGEVLQDRAAEWVQGQDAGAGFSTIVDQVIAHVTARTQ
jgi:hypothetical protein